MRCWPRRRRSPRSSGRHPQRAVLIVGFHYLPPGRRRRLLSRLNGSVYDRDGTQADGLVMGYWDRPFDEAVDLMNEWVARYKAI